MNKAEANQFNTRWETDIYAQGRQINRYPFPAYIGPFLMLFGGAPDRGKINVLEVGCGAGNNIWFFAREGFATHGIEGSATALAYAGDRLTAEGLTADLRHGNIAEVVEQTVDQLLRQLAKQRFPALGGPVAKAAAFGLALE